MLKRKLVDLRISRCVEKCLVGVSCWIWEYNRKFGNCLKSLKSHVQCNSNAFPGTLDIIAMTN